MITRSGVTCLAVSIALLPLVIEKTSHANSVFNAISNSLSIFRSLATTKSSEKPADLVA